MMNNKKQKQRIVKLGKHTFAIKNEINVNVSISDYKYCIGEFPDGSLKGYVVSNNEILTTWSLNDSERNIYDSIAMDKFYKQRELVSMV